MFEIMKNDELAKWIGKNEFSIENSDRILLMNTYKKFRFDIHNHELTKLNNSNIAWLTFSTGCLRNCLFCSISKDSLPFKHIDLKELKKDLAKIKKCDKLFISAPEPFIHPQFFEIIDICSKHFKRIECFGCAELLSDSTFCLKIKKAGITDVQLLIVSTNAEVHDYIVGRKGHYELTLKAVSNLRKAKINTFIYSILMKQTIGNIEEDIRFIHSELNLPYVIVPLRKTGMNEVMFHNLAPDIARLKKNKDSLPFMLGFPPCIFNKRNQVKGNCLTDVMKLNLYFSLKDYEPIKNCAGCNFKLSCPGMLRGYQTK